MILQYNNKIKNYQRWKKIFINMLEMLKVLLQINIKTFVTNLLRFKKLSMIKPDKNSNKTKLKYKMKLTKKIKMIF